MIMDFTATKRFLELLRKQNMDGKVSKLQFELEALLLLADAQNSKNSQPKSWLKS
jgi:hypothetical protein